MGETIHKGPPDIMMAFGPTKGGSAPTGPSAEKQQAAKEFYEAARGGDWGAAADALCALIDLHTSEEPEEGDEPDGDEHEEY